MSLHCRWFIDFLLIEHCNHAGRENGRLQATYAQLVRYGIPRKKIAGAIQEAVARGLVRVTRRGGIYGLDSKRTPSRYRLTWIGTTDPATPATNDWKRVYGRKISPHPASGTAKKRKCRYLSAKRPI
jgi:hypothetical protein